VKLTTRSYIMESKITDRDITYSLRSGLAVGNLSPTAPFLPLYQSLENMFITDSPAHVFITTEENVEMLRWNIDSKRGVAAHVFDKLVERITNEDESSVNEWINTSVFFLASMMQPFQPFILLCSFYQPLLTMYFRKFGFLIFSVGIDIPDYDYHIPMDRLDLVYDLVTRTVHTSEPGDLDRDLLISPRVDHAIRKVNEAQNALKHMSIDSRVSYFQGQFRSDMPKIGKPLRYKNDEYVLSFSDVIAMTMYRETVKLPRSVNVDNSRKFIVAPSGSGKTTYIRTTLNLKGVVIDADSLFEWPDVTRWWENAELAKKVNDNNFSILRAWLDGEPDGKIALYADTFSGRLRPYAAVFVPEDILFSNLMTSRIGQPSGPEDAARGVANSRRKKAELSKLGVPIFSNFPQAVGFTVAAGRIQLAPKSRYFWKYVFVVKRNQLPLMSVQTSFNVQTCYVKSVTYFISRILNLGNADMAVPRRLAIMLDGRCVIATTPHKFILGYYKYKGRLVPMSVSGHMVNYIILTTLMPLDIIRLFDQIKWNMETFVNRRRLTAYEKHMLTSGFFAEHSDIKNPYVLWHNVPEWVVAILAGRIWCEYLGLKIELLELFEEFSDWLLAFGKENPRAYSISSATVREIERGTDFSAYIPSDGLERARDWSS